MNEFKKSLDEVVDAFDKSGDQPAHKRIADIEYIGALSCTSCGDLELGDRYLTDILKQLLADKSPYKPFAGRVRFILEEISMSSGIPEKAEDEE